MDQVAFSTTFYVLGFVGLAGLTTIWLRAWQLLVAGSGRRMWKSGTRGRVVLAVVSVAGCYAVGVWWFAVRRVFRCLTDWPCGPNRSSGWIALAIFGAIYLGFEALLLGARLVTRPAN